MKCSSAGCGSALRLGCPQVAAAVREHDAGEAPTRLSLPLKLDLVVVRGTDHLEGADVQVAVDHVAQHDVHCGHFAVFWKWMVYSSALPSAISPVVICVTSTSFSLGSKEVVGCALRRIGVIVTVCSVQVDVEGRPWRSPCHW